MSDPKDRQRQEALLRVHLRSAIARASDGQLDDQRPRLLAESLAKSDLDKSQIRGLENLAYTTNKVSDITDLLKKQIGRDKGKKRWAQDNQGQDLIGALEALVDQAKGIVHDLPDEVRLVVDPDLTRRVHLELIREFIKHLSAEFMLRKRES